MTLECETRRPAKRVTWLKGMVELRPGRKYAMRQRGVVLSLTIACLEKSDTDIYICDVGTMQSRAQLTVQGESCLAGPGQFDSAGDERVKGLCRPQVAKSLAVHSALQKQVNILETLENENRLDKNK